MALRLLGSGVGEALAVLVGGAVASLIGLRVGGVVLPALQLLAIAPFFLVEVSRGRLWRAAGLVLLWSLSITVVVAASAYRAGCGPWPGERIIHGPSYLSEMLEWVRTGRGAEGDPHIFLRPKLVELALFTVASFATIGLGGLFMGAVLLNYMNFYYGTLVWISHGDLLAAAMGWPIYAIIRVAGYTFLGTLLTRLALVLVKTRGRRVSLEPAARRMLAVAIILIVLDFVLKATIANTVYQPVLHSLADPERLEMCRSLVSPG